MSYVTVYSVQSNGDVKSEGTAHNNHVFAPLIWEILGKKHGYFDKYPMFSDRSKLNALWDEWPSPKMSRREQVLLGATFDRVWVRRDLLPELIDACQWFLDEYVLPPQQEIDPLTKKPREWRYETSALTGIIALLKGILEDPSTRGAAFNCCSAVTSFWYRSDAPHEGLVPGSDLKHVQDADCTTLEDGYCTECGECHVEPCDECGARCFHDRNCSEYLWDGRPWNVDQDTVHSQGEYQGSGAWEMSSRL